MGNNNGKTPVKMNPRTTNKPILKKPSIYSTNFPNTNVPVKIDNTGLTNYHSSAYNKTYFQVRYNSQTQDKTVIMKFMTIL